MASISSWLTILQMTSDMFAIDTAPYYFPQICHHRMRLTNDSAVTYEIRQLLNVKQDLLTFPVHLISPGSGCVSCCSVLIFNVAFSRLFFFLCHVVVSLSSTCITLSSATNCVNVLIVPVWCIDK